MIIKHFIVTYKNENLLKRGLDFINSQSIPDGIHYEVHVINNYGHLNPMPNNNFIGLNNNLRLDSSTGHLARSWNQALMLGFESLSDPKSDIVILSQGDCMFYDGYLEQVIKYHEEYEFLQQGRGDEFHSYSVEHIKKVGIWDERFCGIGYQELDYFYRSCILNPDNIFINHNFHGIEEMSDNSLNIVDISYDTGYERDDEDHMRSYSQAHNYCLNFLLYKYGIEEKLVVGKDCYKVIDILRDKLPLPKIPTYVTYPYFENGISKSTISKMNYWDM